MQRIEMKVTDYETPTLTEQKDVTKYLNSRVPLKLYSSLVNDENKNTCREPWDWHRTPWRN